MKCISSCIYQFGVTVVMLKKYILISTILSTCLSISAIASQTESTAIEFAADKIEKSNQQALSAVKKISKEVQQLKKGVVELNKDLRLMEEELLFPSSTQYTVFVTLDIGKYFTLEGIKLKIDGKMVSSHIYSEKQRHALSRGGVQKLHITNLNEGKHTVTAFFAGLGPNGRPYKRASSLDFDKDKTSRYIELAVVDNESAQEPEFLIKQW